MSFLVRDILDMNLLDGARLVAGEQGSGNIMRWVNIMEILDMPDSVQEHELLITTGYQMEDEQRHKGLIQSLKARGACGIAIQPGYYIPAIPRYILEEGDRLHFPVIELNKELTFSHIMHVLLDGIRQKELPFAPDVAQLNQLLEDWDKGAQPEDSARRPDSLRCIFFLLPSRENGLLPEDAFRQAAQKIQKCLQAKCSKVFHHTQGNSALLYAADVSDNAFQGISLDLNSLLHDLGRFGGLNMICGIGILKPGQSLSEGLHEAAGAAHSMDRIGAYRGLCPSHSIGLMEMIELIQRNRPGGNAPAGPVEKILSYDREHNTAYGKTLRVYLASEGGLSASADRLYIHRHTLANRLNKIEGLCGMRLNDHYARLYLSMELLMHDLFTP